MIETTPSFSPKLAANPFHTATAAHATHLVMENVTVKQSLLLLLANSSINPNFVRVNLNKIAVISTSLKSLLSSAIKKIIENKQQKF
jgi:hypothetical protein